MDYEKLHKDTIAKLQEMVNSGKITVKTACGICADFVPESEDEKVRKEIIYHIQYCDDTIDEVAEKRMIAWLKKQGEQNIIMAKSPQLGERKPVDNGESNLLTVERAKEMSPFMMSSFENESAAWSEEDEDKFNQICSCVEAAPSDVCYYSRETLENWLKSLRPQNIWRPSDEQMDNK